jgi:hypothetical protein
MRGMDIGLSKEERMGRKEVLAFLLGVTDKWKK